MKRQNMNATYSYINEDLIICTGSGYKPQNLHRWGPGVRDIYALHYVISGKGYFKTNNDIYTLEAGESFIVFPHIEVCYYPDSQNPWEYIWIDFKGEEALYLLSMTGFTQSTPIAPVSLKNLEPLFHIGEGIGIKPFEKERFNAKLRLLLSYYMEYYPRINTNEKIDYVLLAMEYIDNNYWKAELTVSDIADFVKIERSYLFRLFKEATGMSISSYITEYRIKRASNLLKSSKISIKSAACSVGYTDQMYFSKVFKKYTSYSPSEYIKVYSCIVGEHEKTGFA